MMNLPEEVRVVRLLRLVVPAVERAIEAHGDGCECAVCDDLKGLHYNAVIAEVNITSQLVAILEDPDRPCPACGAVPPVPLVVSAV
jgi:hypothetical protein